MSTQVLAERQKLTFICTATECLLPRAMIDWYGERESVKGNRAVRNPWSWGEGGHILFSLYWLYYTKEISILSLISNYPNLVFIFLGIISKASTIVGTTVTFIFNKFFNRLARSRYLFSFSLSITQWLAWTVKSSSRQVFKLKFGLVFWLELGDLFLSHHHREFCVPYFAG